MRSGAAAGTPLAGVPAVLKMGARVTVRRMLKLPNTRHIGFASSETGRRFDPPRNPEHPDTQPLCAVYVDHGQPCRVPSDLRQQSLTPANVCHDPMEQFTDYHCNFCQRFFLGTFPEIKKNYIDTGKLRFYTRDLPLDFHPNALVAAQAAHCAADQNQFWTMHNRMSADPTRLDLPSLTSYAKDLNLDTEVFRGCVESGKYKSAVQKEAAEAAAAGVNGTPSFVVGKSTSDGVDGELVVGALPFPLFDQKLKDLSRPE